MFQCFSKISILTVILHILCASKSCSQTVPIDTSQSCNIVPIPADGFVLTIQWPIEFCYREGRCALDQRSTLDARQWTIHGLWPQYYARPSTPGHHHRNLQYCCREPVPPTESNISKQAQLTQQMHQFWPSLKAPSSSFSINFWLHEWNKHGTCAPHPTGATMQDYFATTISLYARFRLHSLRIKPSNRKAKSLNSVRRAVASAARIPANAIRLLCGRPPTPTGIGFLFEIQICLDRSTRTAIDCRAFFPPPPNLAPSFGEAFHDYYVDDPRCGRAVMLLKS